MLALLLAAVSPARAMDGAVTVMPLSGLSAGEVRQCGIRAMSGSDAGQLTVDIALERAGKATDLVVRASGAGAYASDVSDIRIVPRIVSLPAMSAPVRTPQGLERRTPASDKMITAFIHELMLRGTRVVAATADREVMLDFPGPLSASVRAAYLNCAGDLYRPGE